MSPHAEAHLVRWCVLGRTAEGRIAAVMVGSNGEAVERLDIASDAFPGFVSDRESEGAPRWVWSDAPSWYPQLLDSGVRIERCHDLRLSHVIMRHSEFVMDRAAMTAGPEWDVPPSRLEHRAPDPAALFEIDRTDNGADEGVPQDIGAVLEEFERQREAIVSSHAPSRLRLLLAAESAGALAAAEMGAAGVPWDAVEHDRLLTTVLGARPASGQKPAEMLRIAEQVRAELGDPQVSVDSPPKLLRSLRRAGIEVESTSRWELEEQEHPAIAPLLRYKQLSRLYSASGWAWLDEWVHDGRYRPVYVPGGVVTGRWASSGGGALQLPRSLRPALRADPGWLLVSADVAQLEPRVLSAMAGDRAMMKAGFGTDLYAGIVGSGIVATRQEAKIAVLGALYGSTTGDSGRLVPLLRRSFPAAMAVVDGAAHVGEEGGVVSTWLGRSSPEPDAEWKRVQAGASVSGASSRDEIRARQSARTLGRFARNFVVQGTAAEWALAWMAELRARLARFDPVRSAPPARPSGPVFQDLPHLVFFLHDEVIVHTPAEHAEEVAEAVRTSADSAGKLLFGNSPVDFPLDVRISERAAKE